MELEEALRKFENMSKSKTIELCEGTYEKLRKEPSLLRLNSERTLVVGDLHGDLESCLNAFRLTDNLEDARIVFLGDYVDRGPYQSSVINLLLQKKKDNPDRIFLLRGNHETPSMNLSYGFVDTLIRKFGKDYEGVYNAYLKVFSEMPLAATVDNRIILVHGGLARGVEKLEELGETGKGGVEPKDPKIFESLWNDPSENIEGFSHNPRGPGVYCFGSKALERFLKNNNLRMMIRSHEPVFQGYRVLFNGILIIVFSCRFYGIEPAALYLKDDEAVFKSLK
jgi:predicted phosphodiesterase